MPLRYPALSAVVLLTTGCRDARNLLSLGLALNREYADTHVGVTLTDGLILTVTMADSPLLRAPCDSQAVLAMQVATFVRAQYAGFQSLQAVHVAFAPGRSAEPLSGKAAHLPYRFAQTAIRAGLGASDSAQAVDACEAWEELQ